MQPYALCKNDNYDNQLSSFLAGFQQIRPTDL